jgi:hypothetical protein
MFRIAMLKVPNSFKLLKMQHAYLVELASNRRMQRTATFGSISVV